MAKYVLSSGASTTDIVKYIKDLILLNLRVPENSIPMYSFGSPQLITTILDSEIESSIRDVISNVINQITTRNPDVSVSLSSMSITNNTVVIQLTINNQIATYNITV